MPLVKKPPETLERTLRLEEPVRELLDDYCRFVGSTADYVANFALRKLRSRDPEYKRWRAAQPTSVSNKKTAAPPATLRTT